MQTDKPEGEWIEWAGGKCPVAWNTIVQVRFRPRHANERRASESCPGRADFWEGNGTDWWRHNSPVRSNDIVAYRVVQS